MILCLLVWMLVGAACDSLNYFKEAGFEIEKITYDLANEENFWQDQENIETEHENMFKEQGIKIKALIAVKKGE